MSRRHRLDIYADVLRAATTESKPTRIMYHTSLAWPHFQRCLQILIKSNLLTNYKENGKLRYHITDKGQDFLRAYDNLVRLAPK